MQLGRRDDARQKFRDLEAAATRHYIRPEILERAALALGDREKAIGYLEKGADAQSALVQMVTWFPEYRQLLGHPRFERYLQSVHLAEFLQGRDR